MTVRRLLPLTAAVALAAAAGGCGSRVVAVESAPETGASLLITRDFGQRVQSPQRVFTVTKGATAMRQLQAVSTVKTSYGGRYVTAIDGQSQDLTAGRDWLFYVDGVEAERGAADTDLRVGQSVQWDLHDWRGLREDKAIVGAFPQPLRRNGVRLTCLPGARRACQTARRRLAAADVAVDDKTVRSAVRVIVGTAASIAESGDLEQLSEPPASNGLLASILKRGDGFQMRTVDEHGRSATTLGAGSGLVSAVNRGKQLIWVVVGVDAGAAESAADRLTTNDLQGAFAVAVEGERLVRLPSQRPSAGAAP